MSDTQEPVRQNINDVSAQKKDKYICALKASGCFLCKSFLPTSENCHFERYSFAHEGGKLSIVYDTKADMLSFTAKQTVLSAACSICGLDKQNSAVDSEKENNKSKVDSETKNKSGAKPVAVPKVKNNAVKTDKKAKTDKNAKVEKIAKKATASVAASALDSVSSSPETPEYKDGFSIKKCPQSKFDGFLKRIRALKGVTVAADKDKNTDVSVYRITHKAKQEKCILRYVPASGSAQLQGKRTNLFGEVQVILSSDSGFNDAMGSYAESAGGQKSGNALQKSLRKLLPDAFDLLSEQSKIDISIGMVDIGNDDVRLSDYSVLLVPPYRGLERFIYDLQQERAISVKMIGQAYEKDEDGNHRLKVGYRRKNGIVYSEVMSALYNEYFEKRNFYAHSDNSDFGASRMITDKTAAKGIFDNLCEIINYNAKKLKEIGFKPTKDKSAR